MLLVISVFRGKSRYADRRNQDNLLSIISVWLKLATTITYDIANIKNRNMLYTII